MTKGHNFEKKENVNIDIVQPRQVQHDVIMNKDETFLKLLDKCSNGNCKCREQISFTPRQNQPVGARFKNLIQKTF